MAKRERDDPEPWVIVERSKPGWFRLSGGFGEELYVNCALDEVGNVVITRLVVSGPRLTSTDLRRIPVGRIEAFLNAGPRRDHVLRAPIGLDPLRELEEVADEGPDNVYRHDSGRTRLRRPRRGESEEFFAHVAEAYRHYVQVTKSPALDIAAEANVPVPTARRWINEARQRGYLSPGERGRATSGQPPTSKSTPPTADDATEL